MISPGYSSTIEENDDLMTSPDDSSTNEENDASDKDCSSGKQSGELFDVSAEFKKFCSIEIDRSAYDDLSLKQFCLKTDKEECFNRLTTKLLFS